MNDKERDVVNKMLDHVPTALAIVSSFVYGDEDTSDRLMLEVLEHSDVIEIGGVLGGLRTIAVGLAVALLADGEVTPEQLMSAVGQILADGVQVVRDENEGDQAT